MRYLAFLSRLESQIDLKLPEAQASLPVVSLSFSRVEELPAAATPALKSWAGQARKLSSYCEHGAISIEVHGIARFALHTEDRRIHAIVRRDAPESIVRFWILHQALPFFLLLSGEAEMFHASAVEMDGAAVAFFAPSHGGKSTLLSYFLQQQHALITDEHLAVNRGDSHTVRPSLPYHRPYRANEDLGVFVDNFCSRAVALKAIYLLEPVPADSAVAIEPLQGLAAAHGLMRAQQYTTWNPSLPALFPLVAKRFRDTTSLAASIRVSTLRVPRALDRLPEVYDRICNDVRQIA
jgi:hypothetical protein